MIGLASSHPCEVLLSAAERCRRESWGRTAKVAWSFRFRGVSDGWVGECASSLHASLFIFAVRDLLGPKHHVETTQGTEDASEVIPRSRSLTCLREKFLQVAQACDVDQHTRQDIFRKGCGVYLTKEPRTVLTWNRSCTKESNDMLKNKVICVAKIALCFNSMQEYLFHWKAMKDSKQKKPPVFLAKHVAPLPSGVFSASADACEVNVGQANARQRNQHGRHEDEVLRK